eukprot:NODE_6_length_70510_cov_1.054395.p49 type:complete len:167 gc:universal NODE_6_length_70510_cov_1.054395:39138-38638(-)
MHHLTKCCKHVSLVTQIHTDTGILFLYRLGANYQQIPINRAYNAQIANHQRDGPMTVNGNHGSAPNYDPNSYTTVKEVGGKTTYSSHNLGGLLGRFDVKLTDDDFVQAGNLYNVFTAEQKLNLAKNVSGHLKNAKKHIQERQLKWWFKVNEELGRRIQQGLQGARL